MRTILFLVFLSLLGSGAAFAALSFWPVPVEVEVANIAGDAKRGAYLSRLAGCVACHTREGGEPLAGGVALKSKFGTFYSPNITRDTEQGIGTWSFTQFSRAVRQGVAPEGHTYYPAFPYEFYATLTDRDLADIWTALKYLPTSSNVSGAHDVGFPFSMRNGLKIWRTFFEKETTYTPDSSRSDRWNRGKYLVEGPAHCAACHTPRNLLGGLDTLKAYQGDPQMMDGGRSPAITSEALRTRGWTVSNLVSALKTGILPNGDTFGGSMQEIVQDGTSFLLSEHLEDMALYLLDMD